MLRWFQKIGQVPITARGYKASLHLYVIKLTMPNDLSLFGIHLFTMNLNRP